MKKCLVIHCKDIVDNEHVMSIGELKLDVAKIENPTNSTQKFSIYMLKAVTLRIIGNGYFTNNELSQNLGKTYNIPAKINTEVYISNGDYSIIFPNKYDILYFTISGGFNKKININDLKYSTSILTLSLNYTNICDNISVFKNFKKINNLFFGQTDIYGNISELGSLQELLRINLSNTDVYGDIAVFKNTPNLKEITAFNLNTLTGNLGDLPDGVTYFDIGKGKSKFTWTTTSRRYILGTNNVICDNIDKMLQDMAALEVSESSTYKKISLIGTRTSASDAAVATLQSKGYTVSIKVS